MLPLTLPNYQPLPASLNSPVAWDRLRTDGDEHFAIPEDAFQYRLLASQNHAALRRASLIAPRLHGHVVSYGAGMGLVEWWLRQIGLNVTSTDYAPENARRLALHGPARQHDLEDGPLRADTHLMHRIDTELSNRQWRAVFDRFAHERIVFCPGGILNTTQAHNLYIHLVRGGKRAGWLRTRTAIERLWKNTHRAERFELGWVLYPYASQITR